MRCEIRSVNEDDDDGIHGRNGKKHLVELNETEYKLKIRDDASIIIFTPNPYIDRIIRRYLHLLLPAKELLTLPTEDLRKLVEVILSELECRRAKNKKAPITKLVMEIF